MRAGQRSSHPSRKTADMIRRTIVIATQRRLVSNNQMARTGSNGGNHQRRVKPPPLTGGHAYAWPLYLLLGTAAGLSRQAEAAPVSVAREWVA